MTTYWQGQSFVVDVTLTNPATGNPIDGATLTGTVTQPDLTTDSMTVTPIGGGTGRYLGAFEPTQAGQHAYRVEATAGADWATEGTFVVHTSLTGAEPITTDPTSDIGQVRLLATDVDEANPLFTDAQITAFLAIEGGVRLAAALALETIAVSEALVSKKIRAMDLATDGPAVAKELRERAAALRTQQKTLDDATAATDDWFGFDVIDYDPVAAYWGTAELAE